MGGQGYPRARVHARDDSGSWRDLLFDVVRIHSARIAFCEADTFALRHRTPETRIRRLSASFGGTTREGPRVDSNDDPSAAKLQSCARPVRDEVSTLIKKNSVSEGVLLDRATASRPAAVP